MSTLLVIDDEPNLLYSLRKALQSDALRVVTAETADAGINAVRDKRPDAVLLDVRLPDMSGLDAFNEIHRIDPRLPVIVITAHTSTETAIEATKRGAYEYLLKPVEFEDLRRIVQRAIEISRMSHVPANFEERSEEPNADIIVGRSAAMQEVYKAIGKVAPQDVTVLIEGESGTGKEMVARAIYHHSRRNRGPFLAINCAAIPDALLESEMFGHERGSFTGAERQRVGKFEQVDHGTLFLDEIGDMSPATQAKVLRLLQDGSFERVGGNQTFRADVRVIAATNRDLDAMVEAGDFRRDLYYRLKVFSIRLPPLRERREDLPALVEHFIRTAGQEVVKCVRGISREAMDMLQRHDWPGNIRELQSTIKHALIQTVGDTITGECLPASCREERAQPPGDVPTNGPFFGVQQYVDELLSTGEDDLYRKMHAETDRILLQRVLSHVDGSQARAAQILGIARSTLRTRIDDLGLTIEKRVLIENEGADDQQSPVDRS